MYYNQQKKQWIPDKSQPKPAGEYWNVLAVSPQGEPSFITPDDQIYRK